ncbi:MAG: response regulator transcription factor [Myxococcota bacterium]
MAEVVTENEPVSVLIVEDDTWMRDSLARALAWPNSQLVLAASAATGREAIGHIEGEIRADVALVDMGLPDMRGGEVIRTLRAHAPDTVPVVFTVQDDPAVIMEAIKAGALGYLLKSATIQEVLDGLVAAARGGSPMTPSVARMVIDSLTRRDIYEDEPDRTVLTPRETEVLTLLGKGLTYPRVAEVLGIGLGTVQSHVKRIYDKLHVTSKAEAATTAQKMGLL